MKIDFEVIVIGGGPAGMIAAARAGERDRSVLLLEKNHRPGKKLGITGGGRCNVTNNKPVVREMLSQYKDSGKFLFSTFMQYGVTETIAWFKERGVEFVEENAGRLFPVTNQAETIRATLIEELATQSVIIKNNTIVTAVTKDKTTGKFIVTTKSGVYSAESCVVATGGTSHPETGSTGEGFAWLKTLGHKVVTDDMALVPLVVTTPWIAKLSGITLSDVKMTLYANEVKQSVHTGKILFTHIGVTGPTVLNMSKTIGDLLALGTVTVMLDLVPDLDAKELKTKLQTILLEDSNKKIKNVLSQLVPTAVGKVLLAEVDINEDTFCHSVTHDKRIKLLRILKALPLPIKELMGADKAIVSAGGVVLEEIDFKTMESRLVPGLFMVGDVLNINRPSGGYSLQVCWSTGLVAGDYV